MSIARRPAPGQAIGIYSPAMRSSGLLAVLAGCGFHSPAGSLQPTVDAAIPDDAVHDASTVTPDGAATDANTTFCEPIAGVVACYDFEGNVNDASGNGLDASTLDVTFAPGHLGSAMQFGAASAATVAGNPLFDVSAITIEAWINPSQLPDSGEQSDILDVDTQYAFLLDHDGTLTCDIHNLGSFTSTVAIPIDQWTHVACTYDGTLVGQIYVNGTQRGFKNGPGAIAKGGHPMAIAANSPNGSQLIGLIDELRLLSVVRSHAELCTDAARTGCP
jgi:hypothetical protein